VTRESPVAAETQIGLLGSHHRNNRRINQSIFVLLPAKTTADTAAAVGCILDEICI